jgi:hypothetical protein
MAEMMKAALVREFGAPLRIEEVRIPVPVPLTRILALGATSQRNGPLLAISHPPEGVKARAEVADTGAG